MPRLPSLRPLARHFSCALPSREAPRINQVGIQYLSSELQKKVFPTSRPEEYLEAAHPKLLQLAKDHLKQNGLLGKKTQIADPISIPHLPELVGKNTLDEHFTRIGTKYSQPYLSMAEQFLLPDQKLLPKPEHWEFQSGWTRYEAGKPPKSVEYPLEDELVFDVEVLYKRSNYAVLCTAVSQKAWYGWVSPLLVEHTKNKNCQDFEHFIPFNTHAKPKLLVGYNVSYDRARVLEEYSIKQSKAFFLDAMALHVALSGFCSQQRPTWNKYRKHKLAVESAEGSESSDLDLDDAHDSAEDISSHDIAQELMDDPWLNKGSLNSLASVAEFHCGIQMEKDIRDTFLSLEITDVTDNFQELMHYCADDVVATYKVSQKLFPQFKKKIPHPVSFAALRLLGTLFLPTTKKWDTYIHKAESVYQENREQVCSILRERVDELVAFIEQDDPKLKPDCEEDPWLKQLDWTIKPVRYRKDGTPTARQAYLTGYPEWYRDLAKTTTEKDGERKREINITVRSRITPLLLRLKWEGYPLLWTESAGWCFKVPYEDEIIDAMIAKNYPKAILSEEDHELMLPELRDGDMAYELFKVPHPDGPNKRCTLVMSKSYMKYFDSGVLTSEYDYAREILNLNATASYWMGNRARITDQFVVYADPKAEKNKFFDTKKDAKTHKNMGIILPKLCVMGTVTRRATENTWLTASNSKTNRIGSELKAMVEAPKGYAFVGADVDSEELWIASLIGDSMFKIHGGTALGWMTLEGDKNEKTDLHSKTAEIMGISRNDAKVFNYGRIYGAGVKFATRLLKQCNALLSDAEAEEKAHKLYELTKGFTSHSKVFDKRIYHGGSESVMFNALEAIAYQESPRTPVLGASITDALTQRNLNKNNYLTSRVNWTIQSSGVDYLHLLIVAMEYLLDKFKIDARLMITVHDELRYFVKEDQKLMCALLLQISNLWTRAMFCEQLGIKELPQSCAFFSEVDIDFVLRKEVGMDCVTPSHSTPIGPGESYNITRLLEAVDMSFLENNKNNLPNLKNFKIVPRKPVMTNLSAESEPALVHAKLALQNSVSKNDWRAKLTEFYRIQRNQKGALNFHMHTTPESKSAVKSKQTTKKSVKTAAETPKKSGTPKISKPRKTVASRSQEEYSLSKDGDDLLRREIENVGLQKPTTTTSKKINATAQNVKPRSSVKRVFAPEFGSTRTVPNKPVVPRLKTPILAVKPKPTRSTHFSFSRVPPSASSAQQFKSKPIMRENRDTQKPKPPAPRTPMSGDGFSLVRNTGFTNLAFKSFQSKNLQPPKLPVTHIATRSVSKAAEDGSFERLSQPQDFDSECGLRRRRRRD